MTCDAIVFDVENNFSRNLIFFLFQRRREILFVGVHQSFENLENTPITDECPYVSTRMDLSVDYRASLRAYLDNLQVYSYTKSTKREMVQFLFCDPFPFILLAVICDVTPKMEKKKKKKNTTTFVKICTNYSTKPSDVDQLAFFPIHTSSCLYSPETSNELHTEPGFVTLNYYKCETITCGMNAFIFQDSLIMRAKAVRRRKKTKQKKSSVIVIHSIFLSASNMRAENLSGRHSSQYSK